MLLAFIWVHSLHESVPILTMAGLAVWSLLGGLRALQALSLGVLVTFLNPDVFPKAPGADVLKWLILLGASARIHYDALRAYRRPSRSLVLLALFAVVTAGLAWTSSEEPALSLMKLGSFYLGSSSILLAFEDLDDLGDYWQGWLLSLFTAVMISSLPLLFFSVGFLQGTQFQGIIAQGQGYGWYVAPLLCLAVGRWISGGGRDLGGGLLALAGGATILASTSRTAAFALALGLAGTLGVAVLYRRDWLQAMGGLLRRTHGVAAIGLGLLFALYAADRIWENVVDFATQGGAVTAAHPGLYTLLSEARGELIRRSWSNFTRQPLTGIGFGIASDPSSYGTWVYDPLFGLPVSAPIEKGFMPTAVLEEVGIIGAIPLLLLLVSLYGSIIRRGGYHQSWLFLTCIFLNFGDMAFFSFGGLGTHMWLLVGFASRCRTRS